MLRSMPPGIRRSATQLFLIRSDVDDAVRSFAALVIQNGSSVGFTAKFAPGENLLGHGC